MAQQSWASDSGASGFRTTVDISKKVVHAAQPLMKFRQFVSVEPALVKTKVRAFKFTGLVILQLRKIRLRSMNLIVFLRPQWQLRLD